MTDTSGTHATGSLRRQAAGYLQEHALRVTGLLRSKAAMELADMPAG